MVGGEGGRWQLNSRNIHRSILFVYFINRNTKWNSHPNSVQKGHGLWRG